MSNDNLDPYIYNARVLRVVDGDTLDVEIDLGFDISIYERIRLYGINAPESRTRDLKEKERGIAATKFVESLVMGSGDYRCLMKTKYDRRGKFGRVLADILTSRGWLTEVMLAEGHAEKYE